MVVAAPKPKLPATDAPDIKNVEVFVAAGVPKVRPVNKGVDVLEVGNKLGAVVIVLAVTDPKLPLDCICVEVIGVLPNPKLIFADVCGVEKVLNVPCVAIVAPNDVLFVLKLVVDLNSKKNKKTIDDIINWFCLIDSVYYILYQIFTYLNIFAVVIKLSIYIFSKIKILV